MSEAESWDDLTADERNALLELARARANGSVTRRDALIGGGAVLAGSAIGGGASQAVGTAAADASTSDADGDVGTPSDRVDVFAQAVDTEQLNNADYVSTSDSLSTVNTLLSSPGTVVFLPGTHNYGEMVEITSNDVTIIISEGATVGYPDTATPTGFSLNGNSPNPVFLSDSQNNVNIINRGVIDANHTGTSTTDGHPGVFFYNGTNCNYAGQGGYILDAFPGIWWVDVDRSDISNVEKIGVPTTGAAVAVEGCVSCTIDGAYSEAANEVIDLNHTNEDVTVKNVVGKDITEGSDELVDINNSIGCTVEGIRTTGATPSSLLRVSDDAGHRFTQKTPRDTTEDITVKDVVGVSTDNAISIVGTTSVSSVEILDFDVESTGGEGVVLSPSANNTVTDITLRGHGESSSTAAAGHRGFDLGDQSYQNSGLDLFISATSTDGDAVAIRGYTDVSGQVRAYDASNAGLAFISDSTGGTVGNVQLGVGASGSGAEGIVGVLSGAKSNVHLAGYSVGNTGNDIKPEGFEDARIDVTHSTFDYSKANTRLVVNGWGLNAGDPSVGGQWNGNGYEGLMVRDTSNLANYAYVNGGWVAL